MKIIAIFLITICAVQATYVNPESLPEGNILENDVNLKDVDYARNLITNLLERVKNILKEIKEKTEEMLLDATVSIAKYIASSEDELTREAKRVESQMDELSEVLPCFQGQRERIAEILSKAREGIRACARNVIEKVKAIKGEIQEFEDAIKEQMIEIQGIMAQCGATNPIQVIGCVVKNVGRIGDAVKIIASNAKSVLQVAIVDLITIAFETRECVYSELENARNAFEAVGQEIAQCIIDSQKH